MEQQQCRETEVEKQSREIKAEKQKQINRGREKGVQELKQRN